MGLLAYLNPLSYGKKKPSSTDYETILSLLTTRITETKTHLSEIRLRERRLTLLLNSYGVVGWAVWIALVWWDRVPWGLVGIWGEELWVKIVEWGLVALGPVGLILLTRLLSRHFTRARTRLEATLRKLLTEQHEKIEEVKKSTRWYETRELLERYEGGQAGGGGAGTPNRPNQRQPASPSSPSPAQGSRSASAAGGKGAASPGKMVAGQGGGSALGAVGSASGSVGPLPPTMSPEQASLLRMQQQGQMMPVLPTPQKKWYDHLADKLMGDDPSQAAHTQYALVCGGCFRHNGLVGGGKQEWEKLQWICPRCGYFNPAPKSRQAGSGLAPAGSSTPSPAPSTMLASSPSTTASSTKSSSASSLSQRTGKTEGSPSGSGSLVGGKGKASGLKEVTNAGEFSDDEDEMDVDEDE